MRIWKTPSVIASSFFICLLIIPDLFEVYAQSSNKNCQIPGCETNVLCQFLEPYESALVKHAQQGICYKIDQGDLDLEEGKGIMKRLISHYVICNGPEMNPLYGDIMIKDDFCPKRIENVYNEYCSRTHDPNNHFKVSKVKKNGQWLARELFCQVTYCVVNSGTLIEVFKPDIPAEKEFESETKNLCKELKAENISYEDAWYEWRQTFLRFQEKAGPQFIKKYSTETIEKIWEYIKEYYSK